MLGLGFFNVFELFVLCLVIMGSSDSTGYLYKLQHQQLADKDPLVGILFFQNRLQSREWV